jgi:VCBS repeat-containing protein
MRAPVIVNATGFRRGAESGGRQVVLQKPAAGASETYVVGGGDVIDLSRIAEQNLTLVRLGSRLVVLFPDKAHLVIDGIYGPDGKLSERVGFGLDANTTVTAAQFADQFPISSDAQILTAAGIALNPGSSGGINLAGAPDSSALAPFSTLTPDVDFARTGFSDLDPGTNDAANTNFASATAGASTAAATTSDDTSQPTTAPAGATPAAASAPAAAPQSSSTGTSQDPTPQATVPSAAPTAAPDGAIVVEAGVTGANIPVAGTASAAGNVLTNDSGGTVTGVVAGAAASASGNVGAALTGIYGKLTLAADGSYGYQLDNADADTQSLAQGSAGQDVFTYTISDAQGRTATTTITITVNGTNDAPVIDSAAAAAAGTATEGGLPLGFVPKGEGEKVPASSGATGTLHATDVDAGAVLSWSGNAAGTYGDFAIDPATGIWTYQLDAIRARALAQDDARTEQFAARVTDQFGAFSTQIVTISLAGRNDAPTLDLDSGTAGSDYRGLVATEAARSTASANADAAHGVAIAQIDETSLAKPQPHSIVVGDPDAGDRIASISVSLDATATGERGVLRLTPETLAALAGTGLAVTSVDGSLMTISTIAGSGFNLATVQDLIAGLRYVNTEQTFALDIADRSIQVTISDLHGATATATGYVPVIADVADTTGLNIFTGTRFDDLINPMGGSDTVHAGAGNDRVIYTAGDGADALLDGGDGFDTLALVGTGQADTFHALVWGGALTGLDSGGFALPLLTTVTNFEALTLDGLGQPGGLGDTLSYEKNTVAVSVDLGAGTATGFTSIANIENVIGGLGNNLLIGSAGDNTLIGGAGDDDIRGLGGDNTLKGEAGDDIMTAGDGDNTIDTGTGSNTVTAGNGDNVVTAYEGTDKITLGNGSNRVDAGDGDNSVTVGDGDNLIKAGIGDDVIKTGNGDNRITAGGGDDTIVTGAGDDRIAAGPGDDRITTGAGKDVLHYDSALAAIGFDTITDFQGGFDIFEFDQAVVGPGLALGGANTGDLDASRFTTGPDFTDTAQRFRYDADIKTLFYDADGSGAGASQIALAQLEAGTVTAADIRVS